MPIPTPTTHRVAAVVLLIGCLVILADGTARSELTQAVSTILNGSASVVTHVAVAAN